MKIEDAIGRDPERMSGALCFKDSRVTVKTLFDHLEVGKIDDFYEDFPTVSPEAVEAVVRESWRLLSDEYTIADRAA